MRDLIALRETLDKPTKEDQYEVLFALVKMSWASASNPGWRALVGEDAHSKL